jgi:hypothetical protein
MPVTESATALPASDKAGTKPAGSWRHPGWSWAAGRDWIITASLALATLLIGAALGGIPVVATAGWSSAQARDQAWAFLALTVAGLLVLAGGLVIRRGAGGMRRRNGTAYIIREQAIEWTADDSQAFLDVARRQFARVIQVPGPGEAGRRWDWPLGDGAQRWGAQAAELTAAFAVLHTDDDPKTPNGVFMWARWPVAVSFGARATAADRGLVLDVWQRPSRGRAGHVEPAPWAQRPHRFGAERPPAAPAGSVSPAQEFTRPAKITRRPRRSRPASEARTTGRTRLAILLVRLGPQPWGPIPDAPAGPDPARPVTLDLDDAAGLNAATSGWTEIHELRILPPHGTTFAWPAYPALVAEVSAWIRRKAAELDGRTLLLGANLPAEIALGLGIDAGQPALSGWPAHLWPLVYRPSTDAFVIPGLDLGTAATSQPGSSSCQP